MPHSGRERSGILARDWLRRGRRRAGRQAFFQGAPPRGGTTQAGRHAVYSDDGPAPLIGPNMLDMDPPDHTRLRGLVSKAFTPRRIAALRPRIQAIADTLLDTLAPAKPIDLIGAFAFPLPVTVICELLGVPPADRDQFRAWTSAMLHVHLDKNGVGERNAAG